MVRFLGSITKLKQEIDKIQKEKSKEIELFRNREKEIQGEGQKIADLLVQKNEIINKAHTILSYLKNQKLDEYPSAMRRKITEWFFKYDTKTDSNESNTI